MIHDGDGLVPFGSFKVFTFQHRQRIDDEILSIFLRAQQQGIIGCSKVLLVTKILRLKTKILFVILL